MLKYIEVDALLKETEESWEYNPHKHPLIAKNHYEEHKHFVNMILKQPAADVVEVIHRSWQIYVSEDGYEHHFCPECGEDAIFDYVNEPMYDENIDGEDEYCGDVEVGISEHITPCCPNCGARMDG